MDAWAWPWGMSRPTQRFQCEALHSSSSVRGPKEGASLIMTASGPAGLRGICGTMAMRTPERSLRPYFHLQPEAPSWVNDPSELFTIAWSFWITFLLWHVKVAGWGHLSTPAQTQLPAYGAWSHWSHEQHLACGQPLKSLWRNSSVETRSGMSYDCASADLLDLQLGKIMISLLAYLFEIRAVMTLP